MQPLLDHLATWPPDGRCQSYTYQQIHGGANNILYKVSGDVGDFAVKFTLRDGRRRAWREFQALKALQALDLHLAPQPIWLDEDRYAQPVVVQTWLEGEVTAVPPETDEAWRLLVAHYAALAQVMPANSEMELETAVINFHSVISGVEHIQKQCAAIPLHARSDELIQLVQAASRLSLKLPPARLALCRVDANTLNFVRRSGSWASVDWENSGWGDPTFEMVDLMTHPQYAAVPAERWEWVTQVYADLVGDQAAAVRIRTYYPLMLIWWVARLARMLYEVPLGRDDRLVARDPNWQQAAEEKMARYTNLAFQAIHKL
ncbi:MAG: aminoglycoside phosphotransferase family protein [Anaerolineaceae bacterium]|nr:aminoglycoside phosphotransferase family protein [Anaerolineaceae bacterium]